MLKRSGLLFFLLLSLSQCCLPQDEACRARMFSAPEPASAVRTPAKDDPALYTLPHDVETRFAKLRAGHKEPIFMPIVKRSAPRAPVPSSVSRAQALMMQSTQTVQPRQPVAASSPQLVQLFPEIAHLLGGETQAAVAPQIAKPQARAARAPTISLKPASVAKPVKRGIGEPVRVPSVVRSSSTPISLKETLKIPVKKTISQQEPVRLIFQAGTDGLQKPIMPSVKPASLYEPMPKKMRAYMPVQKAKAAIIVDKRDGVVFSGAEVGVKNVPLQPNQIQELLKLGQTALENRQFAVADGIYTQLLRHQPKDSRTLLGAAIAKHYSNKLDEAAKLYRAVLAQEVSNATARHNLLDIGFKRDLAGTVALLQQQVAEQTADEFGYYALGRYFLQQNQPTLATQYIAAAYSLNPNEPKYQALLRQLAGMGNAR